MAVGGALFLLFLIGLLASSEKNKEPTTPATTTAIPTTTPSDTLLSLAISALASSKDIDNNEVPNLSQTENRLNFTDATEPIIRVVTDTLKNFSKNFHAFDSGKFSFNAYIADLSETAVGVDYVASLRNISITNFGLGFNNGSNICRFAEYTKIKVPTTGQGIKLNGDIEIVKNSISSTGQFQLSFNEVNFFAIQPENNSSNDVRLEMTYKNFDVQYNVPEDYEFFAIEALNKLKGTLKANIISIMSDKLKLRDDIDSSRALLVSSCIEYRNTLAEGCYVMQRSSSDSTNSNNSEGYTILIKGLNDFKTLHFTNELGNVVLMLLTNPLEGKVDWYYNRVNLTEKRMVLKFKSQGLRVDEKVNYDENANRWNVQQVVVDLAPIDIETSVENEFVVFTRAMLASKIKTTVVESIKRSLENL